MVYMILFVPLSTDVENKYMNTKGERRGAAGIGRLGLTHTHTVDTMYKIR